MIKAGNTPMSMFTITLIFFIITAFASATHDIAADGFYMLALSQKNQSAFVGVRSTFYRLANIFGNGVLVWIAGYLETKTSIPAAWKITMGIASAILCLFYIYHLFFIPRPDSDRSSLEGSLKSNSSQVMKEFGRSIATYFKKPGVFTLVDPVMGDDGQLYKTYTPALSEKMKGLVRYADILTPNLTELCALTGTEYRDGNFNNTELENLCQQLSAQGPEHIVVTGIHCEDRQIMNFVYSKGEKPKSVMVDRIGGDRSGTGDVISAVIAGMYLNGHDFYDSVKRSTEFASKCVAYCEEQHVPTHWGLSVEMFLRDLMED